ncbi:MAG TPA: hypothetical protein VH600_14765 [Burkholderiales bacterium]|jgi:hypothetical protein
MPNGHDKNWVRLCAAIDGFRIRHGHWPIRVRMYPRSLEDLREHVFSRAAFAKIEGKVKLVADDAPMIAEDDTGAQYNYGKEGFPEKRPTPNAAEWLGVKPKPGEY